MNYQLNKLSRAAVLVVLLSSCETLTPKTEPVTQLAIDAIAESQAENALLSAESQISTDQALSTLVAEEPREFAPVEDRFDVSVKDVGINSFLLGLVDSTDFNLIISPDLSLKISLQLKNVTVSEVLHALTQIYPITVKQENNLFLVSSAETMTAIYTLDYLNIQRSGDSNTSVAGQSVQAGQSQNNRSSDSSQSSSGNNIQQAKSSNIKTKSETDFWNELNTSLNLIIKNEPTANVVVSPHAGIVVVRALPQTQNLIKRYLKSTQKSLDRQVIIEAKIIEVSLNEGFQAGIDWSKMGNTNGDVFTIGQQGQVLQQPTSDSPLNGIFSLLYQGENFAAAIDLLKSQGDVQVLSSPRVSTVNNQKAIIKVGSDEFFVTDVSTTTVTGTSTATTPNVTLTPFFSGISLDVTPQVSETGDIVLHIHPMVSEVTDQPKTLSLGEDSFILPLALTNVRESDSIVRTRSGRVVVIGGLMQNKVGEEENSTPLLGDIPLLGNLFKQTRQYEVKSELVILLKAHIADDRHSDEQLNQVKSRFSKF
ncbi:MAG: pilus (MSHA type) biogenesis protein MshL [Kangiellaceae bacterium]|nr:pilus (MSHA type) biogenesis protein MshL [Kangiellaceae bacterium]